MMTASKELNAEEEILGIESMRVAAIRLAKWMDEVRCEIICEAQVEEIISYATQKWE